MQDGDKKELEKLEVYDLQFKFARRETLEDEEMVVCDIPHQSIATSALTGYHLKIWVTEQSKFFLRDDCLKPDYIPNPILLATMQATAQRFTVA